MKEALPHIISYANNPIIAVVLLACLLTLLFSMGRYRKQYVFQLLAFFSSRKRVVAYSAEESKIANASPILLVTLVVTTFLFVATLSRSQSTITPPPWYIFVSVGALIGLSLILKYVLLWFMGTIFQSKELLMRFREQYFFLIKQLGFIFLPPLFLLFYGGHALVHPSLILVNFGILIFIGLSTYKAFQFFFHSFLSLSYIILYLCSLEILPILLLAKLVKLLLLNV